MRENGLWIPRNLHTHWSLFKTMCKVKARSLIVEPGERILYTPWKSIIWGKYLCLADTRFGTHFDDFSDNSFIVAICGIGTATNCKALR